MRLWKSPASCKLRCPPVSHGLFPRLQVLLGVAHIWASTFQEAALIFPNEGVNVTWAHMDLCDPLIECGPPHPILHSSDCKRGRDEPLCSGPPPMGPTCSSLRSGAYYRNIVPHFRSLSSPTFCTLLVFLFLDSPSSSDRGLCRWVTTFLFLHPVVVP